jgi:5,10-methylenetetrahydrofolate reductase
MPKITDLLAAVQDEVHTAIEFFPPRTPEGVQNLYKRFASFAQQSECDILCPRVGQPWRPAPDECKRAPASVHQYCSVIAEPIYADVTWGAGGSTSDLTLELCIKMKEEYGMEPNMHLTWCVCKVVASRALARFLTPALAVRICL